MEFFSIWSLKCKRKRQDGSSVNRGGSSLKLRGGAIWRGGVKDIMKGERAEGVGKFLRRFQENYLVFLMNNALVYMYPRIQNETLKKECIWVRIRGTVLAKKGAPKLIFHRESRQLPPFAP